MRDVTAAPAPSVGSHRGGQCVVSSFDTVPWDLTLKAVAHHTDRAWILLYVERWLRAPLQLEDGAGGRVSHPQSAHRFDD